MVVTCLNLSHTLIYFLTNSSRISFKSKFCFFFFFNDTATTEIYTLSLHDALPISPERQAASPMSPSRCRSSTSLSMRSEEHTSELQSRLHLVCRLLLEKKKNKKGRPTSIAFAATTPQTQDTNQLDPSASRRCPSEC